MYHPVRILARAVLDLQECVERLKMGNEALKAELGRCKGGKRGN